MMRDNKKEREGNFMRVSMCFCVLYYFVTVLNIYIAIMQLFNGHFFYFVYFSGLFALEKMILIFILRRMEFEQAQQVVLTDILCLGFVYLKDKKEIQDICTFFVAKLYLSVIPIVYLQLWFYFGYELIEKDYMQFGWIRPAIMNFTIIGNIAVLAFSLCLQSLSLDNQRHELSFSLHKLHFLSLIMNPFGQQFCVYSLFTIQIQSDDRFGICVVFYGIAYQITIEILKKFLGFSLNFNEFGMLNFIRRTGVLKAIQIEKNLGLPDYLKIALNFSGIIDIAVHVLITLFVSKVSLITDHASLEYISFSQRFLEYQNITIYSIVCVFVIMKILFTAYISRSIWIIHTNDHTIDDITQRVLTDPDLWFLVVFTFVPAKKSEGIEMQELRLSDDLIHLVDEEELSKEEGKLLNQQLLLKKQSLYQQKQGARDFTALLTRLVRVQHHKCFFEIYQTLTVSRHSFYLDIKTLRIPDWVIVNFLSEIPIFPNGIKINLTQLQKSNILFERFQRFGLVSESVLCSIDASKQTQRHIRATNAAMHQQILLKRILAEVKIKTSTLQIFLDLEESTAFMMNLKHSSIHTPLLLPANHF